jgi:hypothetical protein
MALDPSNPPAAPAAQELVNEIAKALGVEDPTDAGAIRRALASLLEAAGVEGADGTAPPAEETEAVEDPKVVNRKALARGRAIMAGARVASSRVDQAAVRAGRRAFSR